jgi:hypothetical protein
MSAQNNPDCKGNSCIIRAYRLLCTHVYDILGRSGHLGGTGGIECTSQRVGKSDAASKTALRHTRWQRWVLPTRCEVYSVPLLLSAHL